METLRTYLQNQDVKPNTIDRIILKSVKYDDLYFELIAAIKADEITKDDNSVIVEGYTAFDIKEKAPFMNIAAVYNFLGDLRDDPEGTSMIIRQSFPRK